MKRLIILGGTMGVGKTTVCQALKPFLMPGVFWDGDWAWDMTPFILNDETRELALSNTAFLLNSFLQCSAFHNVLFCWVLHEESILNELLSRLHTKDAEVYWFSLVCSEAALRERLERDVARGVRTADVIGRSLPRLPLYDALPSKRIDISQLTPAETARLIFQQIERGEGRIL